MARGLYVPLDVNYRDDPKVIDAGPDAELVYLRALALAKRLGGDGFIHRAHLRGLAGDLTVIVSGECQPETVAKELVASGLWIEAEGGWVISAWLKHNPSDAELADAKSTDAARKAAWRKARQEQEADATQRDEMSHGTRRDATDSEVKKDIRANVPFGDDFERLWMNYPRKLDKRAGLKAYQARRREGASPVLLDAAVGHYAKSCEGRDPTYIKHAATFLARDGAWTEWTAGAPLDAIPNALLLGPKVFANGTKTDPEPIYRMPPSAPMCPVCDLALLACECN